jgi:hypothetical protein
MPRIQFIRDLNKKNPGAYPALKLNDIIAKYEK